MNSGEKGVYVVHAGNQIHPNSNMAQLIPFSDLTGGTETVRFTVINGGTYMSVRDIIMVVCKKDAHTAANTWLNIGEDKKEEVARYLCNFQFPGQGQRVQPVITLEGALKLIMWLPGDMAKDYRSKACGILTRFLGGDSSLVEEIEANAASSAPLNVLAREALQTQQEELEAREVKRIELRERIARVEMLEAEVKHKQVETQHKQVETQRMQKEEALSLEREEHLIKDVRLRVLLRANLMNCLQDASCKRKLLTDGAGARYDDEQGEIPKTVQRVLQDLGHGGLSTAADREIGKLTMQLYRERYGQDAAPDKQEIVMKEGLSCLVNAFYARDHDLIEEALALYGQGPRETRGKRAKASHA